MAPHATDDLSNGMSNITINGTTNDTSTSTVSQKQVHILIAGAGLTGLILAQGLRKFNASPAAASHPTKYTYSIFERDPYAFSRGGGYSLSIHWALTNLRSALPEDILAGLHDCLVNPLAFEQNEPGNFQYLNLRTGEPVVAFPFRPGSAARVSREKIIKLLMKGLDVQFSKHLSDITYPTETTVEAHFADGTSAIGDLLVGADGVRSMVRRVLIPGPKGRTRQLPVRMIGLKVRYPVEKVEKCRQVDVHFYHGGDPQTNAYFWFSFIDLPRPTDGVTDADCQITMAWPYEKGFLGKEEPMEMPATNAERRTLMRQLANELAEPLREMVFDLPEDTELREITLEDWPPEKGAWDNHNGRVTLVGDAAHAMTICKFFL